MRMFEKMDRKLLGRRGLLRSIHADIVRAMSKKPATFRRHRAHEICGLWLVIGCLAPLAQAQETAATPAPISLMDRVSSGAHEMALNALSVIGIDYRYGGNDPETGFDCSGMVRHVVRNALGLDLPRTAREMAQIGKRIPLDDLKPGDLVFFNTMRRAFSHVGIYLGDKRFVHAPSTGGQVRIDDMSARYWLARFEGARRLPAEPQL
jgi:cell wall-associated NlpC family hydrolase